MPTTYGLTYADLYGRVQDYANVNNIVNSKTKAQTAVKDAVRSIAGKRNWEVLKREATITPVASQQAYGILATVTDFDHMLNCWYYLAGTQLPIEIVDDDKWHQRVNNQIVGTPEVARITSTAAGVLQVQFSPIPSASFITQSPLIYFDYIKKLTELSGDTDVPEVPDTDEHMAIVYLAVSDLLGKQGDAEGMAGWEAKATRLLNDAFSNDERIQTKLPQMGKPMIPINQRRGGSQMDYKGTNFA